ncbi:GmrSD restriction endonuclease domain-containing protein [Sphingomonas sp. PB1R3]|uniref:GmrSD restriction endonuclease domain-containing protein n=1 Tax=Sphingomonas flavida TaxID=3096154 RepID=UPI002FC8DD46
MFIEEIIAKLKRGELRIPAFQRGFVWSPDDVAFLMDSIYKSYPFGGVLLWRTKNMLAQERALGPFVIPEPTADYPIDYVLDGQQRITSILGVFATDLPKTDAVEWRDIYFDLSSNDHTQSSQFVALDKSEVEDDKHFPLNIIFDSTAYRKATRGFDESVAERLDNLKKRFQQAQLPFSMVETEEKPKIAIVFERINRKGVPLDTFQLLSAWTWSEDFELKQQFEELAGELEPFGFDGIGEDTDLLLRCAAAVLIGKESAESLLNVSGTEVRDALPKIKKGLKASIDFLKGNMRVQKFSNLPYPTILIPLTAFFAGPEGEQFALTDQQIKTLKHWFWRSVFSRRYSSATKRNLENDIREAKHLRAGQVSTLGNFEVSLGSGLFKDRRFIAGTVDTKAFILLLASYSPKSIVNGGDVQIGRVLAAGNKSEFHHLFPQAHLKRNGVDPSRVNCLANFCMLSASDNKKVGSKSPSAYREKLASNVDVLLPTNLIPPSLFLDDFDAFVEDRAKLLVKAAQTLMGKE